MSPKCRHVNATSVQRLPACLQEALRALLARRELAVSAGAIFFNNTIIGIAVNYFSPKFPPPNRREANEAKQGNLTLEPLTSLT